MALFTTYQLSKHLNIRCSGSCPGDLFISQWKCSWQNDVHLEPWLV